MADNNTSKDRLKEITDSIETGIKDLFQSDKYMQYLRTMSRFHHYSLNNTLLIAMQNPDATLVAGFNKWRDQFSRHVKKGERGIKIIAPTPYKTKKEQEKVDPVTRAPLLDEYGKVQTEEVEVNIPMYRVVSVFDLSQTEGEPLPALASDLTGDVSQYKSFMEALKQASPVPITFEQMEAGKDGYFHSREQRIALREGMSEVQTVSAAIHEIAHSKLHNYEKEKQAEKNDESAPVPLPKDRRTEEVEAESISFAVCTYYGIKTDENSFGYIASWSKGKELPELRSSLELINKTASSLIGDIDQYFNELRKTLLSQDRSHIEVEGHVGTWYVIDTANIKGTDYFLLEHEEHGDEASNVIVTSDATLVIDGVWNGFDDLNDYFDSLEAESTPLQTNLPEPPAEEHPYPLPDPGISISKRNAYGYLNDDMLPLSQERAAELFDQDLTVYLLHEDDTEAMAFEREEIENHSGLFGIEKSDWIELQEYEALKGDGRLTSEIREQLFMESAENTYAIYQLKRGSEYRDYRFEGTEHLQKAGLEIEHANYDFIYSAPLTDFNGNITRSLNQLYEQFNINHPNGFTGHSLSTSDIIALKIDGVVSSHYIDSLGFKELPQFLEMSLLMPDRFLAGDKVDTPRGRFPLTDMSKEQMEAAGYHLHHSSEDGSYHIMGNGTRAFAIMHENNPLRTAELSTEQNLNQIDGILNNRPTVAALEATVKAGGTISLLDLANAVQLEKHEKRSSVVEQLKSKPQQEKEKLKKAPSVGAEMER